MIRYPSRKHDRMNEKLTPIRARVCSSKLTKKKQIKWTSKRNPPPESTADFLDGTVSPISIDSPGFILQLIGSALALRQADPETLWRWNLTRSSPKQILSILSNSKSDRARCLPVHPTAKMPKLTELDLVDFPTLPAPVSNYLTKFMACERSGKKDLFVFIHAETATKLLQKAAFAKDSDDLVFVSRCLQGAIILAALLTSRTDQMLLSMTHSIWTFIQVAHSQMHEERLEKERVWSVINGVAMECASYPIGLAQVIAFLEFSITVKMKKEHKEELRDTIRRILVARTEESSRRKKKRPVTIVKEDEERVEEEEATRRVCEMVVRGVQTGEETRGEEGMENDEEREEVEQVMAALVSDVVRRERLETEGEKTGRWSIGMQTPARWNGVMVNSPTAHAPGAQSKNENYRRPIDQFSNELNESIAEEAKMERKKMKMESRGAPNSKESPKSERVLRSAKKVEEGVKMKGKKGRGRPKKEKEKEKKDNKVNEDEDVLQMDTKRGRSGLANESSIGRKKSKVDVVDGRSIRNRSSTTIQQVKSLPASLQSQRTPSRPSRPRALSPDGPSSPLRSPSRAMTPFFSPPTGRARGISPAESTSSRPPVLERQDKEDEREENDGKMKGRKKELSGRKMIRGTRASSSFLESTSNLDEQPCTSTRKRGIAKDSGAEFEIDKDAPTPKRKRGRPPKLSTPGDEMVRQLREKTEEESNLTMEVTSANRPSRERKSVKVYDPTPRAPKKRTASTSRREGHSVTPSRKEPKEEPDVIELSESEEEVDMGRDYMEDPDYQMENGEKKRGEERTVYQINEMDEAVREYHVPSQTNDRPRPRTIRNKTPLWDGLPFRLPAVISVGSVIQVIQRTEGAVEGMLEDQRRMEEEEEAEMGEGREDEEGEGIGYFDIFAEHSYARRMSEEPLNEEIIIDVVTLDDDDMEEEEEKNENEIQSRARMGSYIDDDVEEIHEIIEDDNPVITMAASPHPIEDTTENVDVIDVLKEIVDRVCEADGEKKDKGAVEGNVMLEQNVYGESGRVSQIGSLDEYFEVE